MTSPTIDRSPYARINDEWLEQLERLALIPQRAMQLPTMDVRAMIHEIRALRTQTRFAQLAFTEGEKAAIRFAIASIKDDQDRIARQGNYPAGTKPYADHFDAALTLLTSLLSQGDGK